MAKKIKTSDLFDAPKTAQEQKLEGVQNLYNFLFEACNIIRGPVSQDNFKDYITPILYYKRISDVYDEESEVALEESGGDEEYASLPEQHRFVIPDGCHWQDVRERTEQNLISSIDFLKQLLQMARELLEAEKEIEKPMDKRAQARAALTDLFQSIKSEETPIIVEQVVNDIDNEVVNIIRQFNDAFQSVTAKREIKKKLRSILWIKYQIKDNDVFEKAYSYIEMYY